MTIFVSKLTRLTKSDELLRIFGDFGSVKSAQVMMDRVTGRSKCFGFVEMESEEEAAEAILGLHNSELDGSTITVKKVPPKN
jgi:RNA recognition motif-containing protein